MSAAAKRPVRNRLVWVVGLLRVLVPRETRIRYRTSLLDMAWAFVTPLALLVVYGIVLTSFGVEASHGDYLTSAWIGLVLWTYVATVVSGAVTSLVSSSDLVTKVYFPREALPLAISGSSLLDLAIGVASILVLLAFRGGTLGWSWFLLPLPVLILVVWSAAIGVLVAVVAVFVRDTIHGVNLALRVGFFATPVVYDASVLPEALRWTDRTNPVSVAIEGTRDIVMEGAWPSTGLLFLQLTAGSAVLLGSIAFTRRVEARVADAV